MVNGELEINKVLPDKLLYLVERIKKVDSSSGKIAWLFVINHKGTYYQIDPVQEYLVLKKIGLNN